MKRRGLFGYLVLVLGVVLLFIAMRTHLRMLIWLAVLVVASGAWMIAKRKQP